MIERDLPQVSPQNPYAKKITAYLDGSLSPAEKSEFEAYVATHPEFEGRIKARQEELELLKTLIPATNPSAETLDGLEREMKVSAFNLLKEEPRNFLERTQQALEEWLSR